MLVDLKMLCNLFDTSRQDRHLSLWATNVVLVDLSQSNRFVLVIFAYVAMQLYQKTAAQSILERLGVVIRRISGVWGLSGRMSTRMFEYCQKS